MSYNHIPFNFQVHVCYSDFKSPRPVYLYSWQTGFKNLTLKYVRKFVLLVTYSNRKTESWKKKIMLVNLIMGSEQISLNFWGLFSKQICFVHFNSTAQIGATEPCFSFFFSSWNNRCFNFEICNSILNKARTEFWPIWKCVHFIK
jgi:hypothetical protein